MRPLQERIAANALVVMLSDFFDDAATELAGTGVTVQAVLPGATLRIRGKGVPHLRGQGRGDLYVHLDVRTPMKLDAEQERLLREFAKTRGEEVAELSKQGGFFSRMRDAFNGR